MGGDVVDDRLIIISSGNDGRRWIVGRVVDVGEEPADVHAQQFVGVNKGS